MTGTVPRRPWSWGAVAEDWDDHIVCDRLADPGSDRLVRAVDVEALPATTWDWVCQLRRAPYSYDLLDNFGRRSPREPDPGLTSPRPGDSVMTIFTVVDVRPGRELTLRMDDGWPRRVFGDLHVGYRVLPRPHGCRLVAVLRVPDPPGGMARLRRRILAWGDLLMMRKQLLTLAHYARAADARADGPGQGSGPGPRPGPGAGRGPDPGPTDGGGPGRP